MIHYSITAPQPKNHLFVVTMTIEDIQSANIILQLPAWRPGRYELQNFAKNIVSFGVINEQNQPLVFQKISKDAWQIDTCGSVVKVTYQYYANVINAGSSFLDEHQWYINFVNCLPYIVGRINEKCTVELAMPSHYKITCGLPQIQPFVLQANDFYELADSPMMASGTLQHQTYSVKNTDCTFHFWFQGNYIPDNERLISDFSRFTQFQIEQFGDIPCEDYHFLIHILPTPHYHGVEHRNSTVIVLGPDTQSQDLYFDLLGICSHELYHTWNICKIRPKELLPYRFYQENYFYTGFVAEGVTTYMGDLTLVQSGVFSEDEYLKELGTSLKKHLEKDDQAALSLAESSYDLWLDGYVAAVPNRRVSIYSKGAAVALILDLMIRKQSHHQRSLHDVMRLMWQRFGKPFIGYETSDYQAIAEEIIDYNLQEYFDTFVWNNTPIEQLLNEQLAWVGLHIAPKQDGVYVLFVDEPTNDNRNKWLGNL